MELLYFDMGNYLKPGQGPFILGESEEDEELNFYIDVEDPNLGPCKIYTSSKMPLCYILKEER